MRDQPLTVQLGDCADGGLAPAIFAIVDRGVSHRPELANDLKAAVELDFGKRYPAVCVRFDSPTITVQDGAAEEADLRIKGELADLVSLMITPRVGGLPNPVDRRGRAALGMLALGKVRVEGKLGLLRRFLGLIGV